MRIIKSVANVTSAIGKFMARYAGEASNVADIFRTILPALPIDKNDKAKVENVINELDLAADRITAFLNENPLVGEPVKVKASDVADAVKKYLEANPAVIETALAKVLADEGNDNA
jgi:hypothetical protein